MRTASDGAAGRHIRTLLETGEVGGLPDGRLLERFMAGEGVRAEAAFAALVERHGPMVWRACRAILADPNDADDAFQATFLVMVRRARSLVVRDSLGPWLFQVARRTSMRARALTHRRRFLELTAAGLKPHLAVDPPPDELGAAIHEEVERLPERYRAVVVLCLLEGLPDSQAAARLGWPLGTVHSRLARGREKLRRGLTRRGIAPAVALASSRTPTEAASAAVPERLIEATVGSASRLASLGLRDAALPAAVAALTQGVLRMTWIATIRSAAQAVAAVGCVAVAAAVASPEDSHGPGGQPPGQAPMAKAPLRELAPQGGSESLADSVVEIRVGAEDATARSGLGTVISSTPEGSIILTAARLVATAQPPEVPSVPILVDFQGRTHSDAPSGSRRVAAEVVAIDVPRQVALLRIRPGRILGRARVVPMRWAARAQMPVAIATHPRNAALPFVGSEILEIAEAGFVDGASSTYMRSILCSGPDSHDVVGGGLFVGGPSSSGEIAGVCQRPVPTARGSLAFSPPEAIYPILDANGLAHLYRDLPDAQSPAEEPPGTKIEGAETAALLASTVHVIASDGHEPEAGARGLGTVISSSPDHSIILTCAHLLYEREPDETEGGQRVPTILVILNSTEGKQGPFEAEVIKVVPERDLAVLRIRPGVTLPARRVAPPSLHLTARALARRIDRPGPDGPLEVRPTRVLSSEKLVSGLRRLRATVCSGSPPQGTIGGGLFLASADAGDRTPQLVGVSNFADRPRDRSLYTAPDAIYEVLASCGLASLYQDATEVAPPPEMADSPLLKHGPGVAIAVEGGATPVALGTVIFSTEAESILLTAGSIFAGEKDALADPKRFGRKVTVYYGRPRTDDEDPIPPVWGTAGEVVDFDPIRNVGLVRFRPGRKLATVPVVPPSWKAARGAPARLIHGLSGDQSSRAIRNPSVVDKFNGAGGYEAIECEGAPGRTNVGAPLIIMSAEGRNVALAGVCNYASPEDDAGYYAAPAMIYHILDANGLSDVYRKGNEAFGLAPPLPFKRDQRVSTPQELDRIDSVERRVNEIDKKLDRILEALQARP